MILDELDYQLFSISSFYIGAKYENSYPPSVYEVDSSWSVNQIIKKEYEILNVLNFDILYISSFKLLEFFIL